MNRRPNFKTGARSQTRVRPMRRALPEWEKPLNFSHRGFTSLLSTLLILALAASTVLAADHEALRVKTILILDQPVSQILEDSIVKFTGKLVRADTGEGVASGVIKIFDSDVGFDDLMASGMTESDGTFVIEWGARPMDPFDRTVEAYAEFEGTAELEPSRGPTSGRYTIIVEPSKPPKTVLDHLREAFREVFRRLQEVFRRIRGASHVPSRSFLYLFPLDFGSNLNSLLPYLCPFRLWR